MRSKTWVKLSILVVAVLFTFLAKQFGWFQASDASKTASSSATNLVEVTRVVDGDTIEITGGQKVRYIGVDTPETVDPRKTVQCFGKEASAENKKLVEGKKVKLVKDVSETDQYGRLLRYVYLPGGNSDGSDLFVNDFLVSEGYARLDTFPPDVAFQDKFLASEKEAQSANKGLWNACTK